MGPAALRTAGTRSSVRGDGEGGFCCLPPCFCFWGAMAAAAALVAVEEEEEEERCGVCAVVAAADASVWVD
jgi:hypothetical protein